MANKKQQQLNKKIKQLTKKQQNRLIKKQTAKAKVKAKKLKQAQFTQINKSKFVYKNGQYNDRAIQKIVNQHKDQLKTKSDLMEFQREIKRLSTKTGKVSVDLAVGSFFNNKLQIMLANTGLTLDQLAMQSNSSVDQLLDPTRWSNNWSVFTNSVGEQYTFEFDNYQSGIVFAKA